jgi:large subunit ribosomal protein L28
MRPEVKTVCLASDLVQLASIVGMVILLRFPLGRFGEWPSRRDFRTRFEVVMGSECAICHKKPVRGNQKVERGKAKYLGGNGRKTTGITKRWFRPNLQSLRMQTGETSKRVRVCVQCLRTGLVVKRVVKKPFTIDG